MKYETQLMGKPEGKTVSVKEIYFCANCEKVSIRHRALGSKSYVRWCCGNKMIKIANKCHICGLRIKGNNHFQGKHHIAAVTMRKAMSDAK